MRHRKRKKMNTEITETTETIFTRIGIRVTEYLTRSKSDRQFILLVLLSTIIKKYLANYFFSTFYKKIFFEVKVPNTFLKK